MGSDRKLRIALALDDTLDKPDGVQQYMLLLGDWLASRGHTVHFLVAETKRRDLKNVHSLAKVVELNFNGNVVRTTLPVANKRLKLFLQEQKYDVLHLQMPFSPLFGGRLVKNASKSTAIIGTFHILPFSRVNLMASQVLGAVSRPVVKQFTDIMAVSEPAAKLATQIYGLAVSVVPNMVQTDSFKQPKLSKDKSSFKIVFLGRLVERKGCQYLVQAIYYLKQKNQTENLRVIIGGDGPLRPKLENYVKTHGLENLVVFEGYISESRKSEFLGQADITVFPSTSGESFGIVLLEAMAIGNSVVLAGNNPGYSSVITRREQLFEPQNTAEFAELVTKYSNDELARNQAINWQNKHIKQFDVDNVGQKIESIYAKALQSTKSVR